MRPPDNEGRPPARKGGPQEHRRSTGSINRGADESAFCRCGEPILWRTGECLDGHPLPQLVLVRRGHGRARWVRLEEVA